MVVAIGIEEGERAGEIPQKVSEAELAIDLPHGIWNMIYILLFIWSKYDLRFHAIFLTSN